MENQDISPDEPVDQLMRRRPETVAIFLRHRMSCVGCAVGPFHTVAEASAAYHMVLSALLKELQDAVSGNAAAGDRGA